MTMYSRIASEASPIVVRHAPLGRLLELLRRYGRQIGLPLVLALLITFFALTSDVFFTVENFRNVGVAAAALASGLAVGLVNGLVITRFKVFPFIATLAMMSIASGLGLQLAGGVPMPGLPEAFGDLAYELVLGIPVPVLPALL